jgi:hypothetical protein
MVMTHLDMAGHSGCLCDSGKCCCCVAGDRSSIEGTWWGAVLAPAGRWSSRGRIVRGNWDVRPDAPLLHLYSSLPVAGRVDVVEMVSGLLVAEGVIWEADTAALMELGHYIPTFDVDEYISSDTEKAGKVLSGGIVTSVRLSPAGMAEWDIARFDRRSRHGIHIHSPGRPR